MLARSASAKNPANESRNYTFETLQTPVIGAAFGQTVFARRPIEPPLVLRLRVHDGSHQVALSPMLPTLVAHVALTNVDGTQLLDLCHLPGGHPTGYNSAPLTHSPLRGHGGDLTNDQDASDELMVEALCGDCIANGTYAQLGEQVDCVLFVWADLSVRVTGWFRLWVSLFLIDSTAPVSGTSGHAVNEVLTDVFEIVEPSAYRPPDVTYLTSDLKRQGII